MLVSKVGSGEELAVPTIVCAARWKTASTPFKAFESALEVAKVAADIVDLGFDPLQGEA